MNIGKFVDFNIDLREVFNSLKCVSYRLSMIRENYWLNIDQDSIPGDFIERLEKIANITDLAIHEFQKVYPNG
jgi:predicted transcriptional regulator